MSTPTSGEVTPILMPQAGQSMEEGMIVRWLAAAGDQVRQGDVLFEVETDKAVVEAEATASGRLARIVVNEGETVPVKAPVAYLAAADADVDAYLLTRRHPAAAEAPTAAPEAPAPAPAATHRTSERIAASPLARKLAKDLGVALESIGSGSGPHGRIVAVDVRTQPLEEPAIAPALPEGAIRIPMSRMRRAIARGLTASKQTVPHFYMKVTVDAGPLLAFHKAEKERYPCSLNDVITASCARLLFEFPAFRGRVTGDEIVQSASADIGIAVGTDDGLVVPVLKRADEKSLKGIAAGTRRIVQSARGGKVEGMGEGTFTINNLGMFGVEEFSAIINPPESAILAVGAAREDVIVREGAIRAGRVMTLTLSADHRIIDGLLAAKFLARLKELLESPELI